MELGIAGDNRGRAEVRSRELYMVVRDVVQEFAPEELPLLAVLRHADQAHVERGFRHRRNRDDLLGFGIGETVVLVTPIVLTAIQQVVNRIADSAADSAYARFRVWLRRMLHRKDSPARLPHFGAAELGEVHSRILMEAGRTGMDECLAEQLADRVIARLAMASSGEDMK